MIEFVGDFLQLFAAPVVETWENEWHFISVKNLVATVAEASPAQFNDWHKAWRAAADGGSAEPLLTFVARERGVAEDVFLQRLAAALGWPFLELPKLSIADRGAEQAFHENRLSIFRPAHGLEGRHVAGRRERSV